MNWLKKREIWFIDKKKIPIHAGLTVLSLFDTNNRNNGDKLKLNSLVICLYVSVECIG